MASMRLFSFPAEIQRRIIAHMDPDDLLLLVSALVTTPNLLKGVFQLITNHGEDSFFFEATGTVLPHIRLEDYDPSKHRALINIVELVDFFHVDQKKLYRKLSHKTNFIYVSKKSNLTIDLPGSRDNESSDIEELSEDDYEDLTVDEDDEPGYVMHCKEIVRRNNRLRTFFQRFLPFSKIFFFKIDLTLNMIRCPNLEDVTIALSNEVVLEKASSGLPRLLGVDFLDLKYPTQELLRNHRDTLSEGVLHDLNIGDDEKRGPGYEMKGHFFDMSDITLYHFHTIEAVIFSCKTLVLWLCDTPQGERALLDRVFLIDIETLSIHFSSQPPIISNVGMSASIQTLTISEDKSNAEEFEYENACGAVSEMINELFAHITELKTLVIAGKNPIMALLVHDIHIDSAALTTLSLSFPNDEDLEKIDTACTTFPNITSLTIEADAADDGVLRWLPKIVAPKLQTLSVTLARCSANFDKVLGDFFKQFPTVQNLVLSNQFTARTQRIDTSNWKEVLSAFSTNLVSLKLRRFPLNFLNDPDQPIELPNLEILKFQEDLNTRGEYKRFELNLLAPKLEKLKFSVKVDGPTIIKNFPSLKNIRTDTMEEHTVLENLPELIDFSSRRIYGETKGRNLPKLEVIHLPHWRGSKDNLSDVLHFDETVNPNYELVTDMLYGLI